MASGSPAGRRVGRKQLRDIHEQLAERDLSLLASVAAHRYLTTRHIERFHFSDHHSQTSAARSCRRVLQRLHDLHLLARLDRRVGGVRAGSSGFIWRLAAAGERLLAGHEASARQPRSREPSPWLAQHCLAIADAHLAMVEANRGGQLGLLDVQLEPASWRSFLGLGGERRLVRPDLTAVTASGKFEDHWFLEVDLGTEHPPTVIRKCRLYEAYRASGQEQGQRGVFPRIVWIVQTALRADRLAEALSKTDLDPSLFRVTPADDLVTVLQRGAE